MSVINLKEIVENYARTFFKENEKEYYKKLGKSLGWKELHKEIEWKKLRYVDNNSFLSCTAPIYVHVVRLTSSLVSRIRHEKAAYENVEAPGKLKSHCLFRSTFINDTSKEQEYQLRTERKTTSTCDIELFEGYVAEGSLDLSLDIPIPGCVLKTGTGFKRQYSLDNSTSKSFSEEVSWSVESVVKVCLTLDLVES